MNFIEDFCGITHYTQDKGWLPLPLEEVRAKISIVDVSARVILTQVFYNEGLAPINKAKYVFAVPARSAISAFELEVGDEKLLVGVVKEKNKASEEYEAAARDGKFAGLVEWISDDTFTLSIGVLPPRKTITARIMFVMDLMDDEYSDQVRFQLPMTLGRRYGEEPPGLAGATRAPPRSRVKLTAAIQMSGKITSVGSPSHRVTSAPFVTYSGRESLRRMTTKYRSKTLLESDFVLVVQSEGLDEPRCFAERSPLGDTVALQLSLVPKFNPTQPISQEFIFLVDISGSMSGRPLETVKETIHLLLRWLPNYKTTFNVFSFNDHVVGLWPGSVQYDQAALDHALSAVDKLQAGGGTVISNALDHAFKARDFSKPTVVFVLTDGEDNRVDEVTAIVSAAVANCAHMCPLRVFTMGIGTEVSTAMCEGIAHAGKGVCLLATTAEEIMGKCNKLLRAGRNLAVENVFIDWGFVGTPTSPVGSQASSPARGDVGHLQQSPPHINRLHPGVRSNIFAILPQSEVPKQVILRGRYSGDHGAYKLAVQVRNVRVDDDDIKPPIIHTLAARRFITDLESDQNGIPHNMSPDTRESIRKGEMVRLGEKYQLATRYTSFVAVENTNIDALKSLLKDPKEIFQPPRITRSALRNGRIVRASRPRDLGLDDYVHLGLNVVLNFLSRGLGYFQSDDDRDPPPRRGASYDSDEDEEEAEDQDQNGGDEDIDLDIDYDEYSSADSLSTLSSFMSSYSDDPESSEYSDPPTPRPRVRLNLDDDDPSPTSHALLNVSKAPEDLRTQFQSQHRPRDPAPPPPPPPIPDEIFQLSKLQMFDGSFPLDDQSFTQIVGKRALDEKVDVNPKVWATAVAVAFIKKHLLGHPEVLDNVLAKTMEFVMSEMGSRERKEFKRLVDKATPLVA